MHGFRFPRFARLLLLPALLLPLAIPASAQSATDIARVVSLMQANNYNFITTKSPSVWVVHFTGDHLKDIKVVIAVGEEPDAPVIAFVTVTTKQTMPVTTDLTPPCSSRTTSSTASRSATMPMAILKCASTPRCA